MKRRKCADCGADITHRHVNTRVCLACSSRRNTVGKSGTVYQTLERPGRPGSVTKFPRWYRAAIRIDGKPFVERFEALDDAERWLDEQAQVRTL